MTLNPPRRDAPWRDIDPGLADTLEPAVAPVVKSAMDHILAEQPALSGDVRGAFGAALAGGIEAALRHFLSLLGTDRPALDAGLRAMYEDFGARELRHGRALDNLLAAYRSGARTTWNGFAEQAMAAGTPTAQVVRLAEAIFAYIDELSATSVSGFAAAQAGRAGARDVARSRLVTALLEGQAGTDPARVDRLAAEADWRVPAHLVVAVLVPETPMGGGRLPPPIGPPEVLVHAEEGETGDEEYLVVVPGGKGRARAARLAAVAGAGHLAYVGTQRAPASASLSLAHARAVRRLVEQGALPGGRVVDAANHLPELVLHADPQLYADLRARALAPIAGLAPAKRAVAVRTLASWLTHQGDRSATAEDLGVHPQTVSYRMARLMRAFGEDLGGPEGRFAVELAVRAEAARLSPGPAGRGAP